MTFLKSTLVLFIIVLVACNPQAVMRERQGKAEVDSVLFYKKHDLSDPFIDAILSTPSDHAELHKTLVPPPAPVPRYKQIDGFRVQIFAGFDSLKANSLQYRLNQEMQDSVYIKHEEELYKVQIGDFHYRPQADKLKRSLKNNQFPGAWTVQTIIQVPITAQDTTALSNNTSPTDTVSDEFFKIQVFATDDEAKALTMLQDLRSKFGLPVYYSKADILYKIFIGKFKTRLETEKKLKSVQKAGYTDAWIVSPDR
ncbi:MAG: hypothetical protein GF313_13085 [Caldithrix sp.]|nr:hypothetical protein [Caldithrix sp.]